MSNLRYVPATGVIGAPLIVGGKNAGDNKRTNIAGGAHTLSVDDFNQWGEATIELRGVGGTDILTLPNDDAIPTGAVVWVFRQGAAIVDIRTAAGVTMRHSDGTSGDGKNITITLYQWARCSKASSAIWDVLTF